MSHLQNKEKVQSLFYPTNTRPRKHKTLSRLSSLHCGCGILNRGRYILSPYLQTAKRLRYKGCSMVLNVAAKEAAYSPQQAAVTAKEAAYCRSLFAIPLWEAASL